MYIGFYSLKLQKYFSFFFACSIGIWFSLQSIISIGSVIGMLPTKGITLPFISYGGSSLLIMSLSIFLLIRIDYENKLSKIQAFIRV